VVGGRTNSESRKQAQAQLIVKKRGVHWSPAVRADP
jgi:hypothetical protein